MGVDVCQRLGDKEKEALANKLLTLALAQSGKADQAPNRVKSLLALERAMGAVERKCETDFKRWWYEVQELGGVTDNDIKESIDKLREHGGLGLDDFLRSVGAPFMEKRSDQTIHQFTKPNMYVMFRTGGIQYGPRFQCVSPYRCGDVGGKSIAHLRPSSQADHWEANLGFHSGILDGCLQSGTVIAQPNVW